MRRFAGGGSFSYSEAPGRKKAVALSKLLPQASSQRLRVLAAADPHCLLHSRLGKALALHGVGALLSACLLSTYAAERLRPCMRSSPPAYSGSHGDPMEPGSMRSNLGNKVAVAVAFEVT